MLFNNLYNSVDSQRFAAPTRLFFGPGSRARVLDLLPAGAQTVVVADSAFADHPFLKLLRDHVEISFMAQVAAEPDQSLLRQMIDKLGKSAWTGLVAIGGGSTIDTAKALLAHRIFGHAERVGYGAMREIPDVLPGQSLVRFITLPTTAGSGSETSRYYLLLDSITHEKIVGRSWSLCPFASILDPELLLDSPRELLVQSAFDAFTHLWETLHCRQEASPIVEALATDGIARQIQALKKLEGLERPSLELCQDLQVSAAFGGIALSNVRTGILHDAGETLVAQCPMPHSLSLYTFFSASLVLFAGSLEARSHGLAARLSTVPEFQGGRFLEKLESFWERQFKVSGAEEVLCRTISRQALLAQPIIEKILSDQVLVLKEAPCPLNSESVSRFVADALSRWCS